MTIASTWQRPIPHLQREGVTVREIALTDEDALFPIISSDIARRLYSPPPDSREDFRRFIRRARRQHQTGDAVCLVAAAGDPGNACGLFQVRRARGGAHVGEWGFVLDASQWSQGTFVLAASLVLDYLFDVVELRRLEARVIIDNGRAGAALMKLGARPEGILQQAFGRDDTFVDAVLWTILRDQWIATRTAGSGTPNPPSFAA